MAKESIRREVHKCDCEICCEHPHGNVARAHRNLNRLVSVSDERVRRLLVGFLAEQRGRGGVSELSRVTGLDRKTIAKGRRELRDGEFSMSLPVEPVTPRVRRPGGGRKLTENKVPGS